MWKRLLMLGAVAAVIIAVAALTVHLSQENRAMAADQKRPGGGPELAHMVFFQLKDASDANREKMLQLCKDYLDGHDGVTYFSVGTRNEALEREVNDKDYDIALHLVFKDKAAHDTYQKHERHDKFVSECQALWSKVRVFDTDIR